MAYLLLISDRTDSRFNSGKSRRVAGYGQKTPMQGLRSRKQLVRNVGLVLLSLALLLLLSEAGLRVAVALFTERFTRVDPFLGWYHNPNASDELVTEGYPYRLGYNSHGFRRPEHDYAKPPGVFRIVVLGDGYVDGAEVGDEETLTWRMQERGDGVEVINLGVYGFSTAQQLLTLERFGLKYAPDWVVLVTVTNDYTDNLLNISDFGARPRYVLQNDSLVLQGTDHPAAQAVFRATNLPVPGHRLWHRHSYVYYALNYYIYQRLIADKLQGVRTQQMNVLDHTAQRGLYLRLVQRMKSLCDEAGAGLLVVFGYPKASLLASDTSPNQEVSQKLAERGIQYLDLFDSLRQAELSGGQSLYYVEDVHWNLVGHAHVGRELTAWFDDRQRHASRDVRHTAQTGLAIPAQGSLPPERIRLR